MKLLTLALSAALCLAPALAHADDKSDAILREVALRFKNATTYSVTLAFTEDKDRGKMTFFLVRPDRFRLELTDKEQHFLYVINGEKASITQGKDKMNVPAAQARPFITQVMDILSGMFTKPMGGIESTTYVTQKMLDEHTVVDIIDIKGKESGKSARVYIDNNAVIRRILGRSKGKGVIMEFINPTFDEPIPAGRFSIDGK